MGYLSVRHVFVSSLPIFVYSCRLVAFNSSETGAGKPGEEPEEEGGIMFVGLAIKGFTRCGEDKKRTLLSFVPGCKLRQERMRGNTFSNHD